MRGREAVAPSAFLAERAVGHVGCDPSWSHRVNADVVLSKFQCYRLGQSLDCMFRCDIDAGLSHTHMAESARGVADCATSCLAHRGNLELHSIEHPPDIDVEDLPVLCLG